MNRFSNEEIVKMFKSTSARATDAEKNLDQLLKINTNRMCQSLTDLEIAQIESEQATTDLEIQLAEMQAE